MARSYAIPLSVATPHSPGGRMTDPISLAIITLAFAIGGFVKGFAGMGLPLVTIAALTFAFGLPNAVALMTVSGLATNLWQAFGGNATREAFRRILPFLVACCLFVWFGTGVLVSFDESVLVVALGLLLVAYASLALTGWNPRITPAQDRWLAPVLGAVNGVCCGITGITSVPSIIYVRAMGLPRETMIQAMGMLFGLSYVAIVIALAIRGTLNVEIGTLSLLAVLPAFAGMWLGRRVRFRTGEAGFAQLFNWLLLLIGLGLILRSI